MNWEIFCVVVVVIATRCGLAEEIFEVRTFGENKKCLAVELGKSTDGAGIVLLPCTSSEPNFQWYRIQSKSEPEYFNILTKQADNKCLSVPAFNGANRAALVQWSCEDNDNQQWMFMASDLSQNVVYLKNKFSGKCVAVDDENLTDGSKIVQWDCDQRYNQQLYVLPPIRGKIIKDGTTTELRTFGDRSKCLAVPDATKTDGARVILLSCNDTGHNFLWHAIQSKSDPEYFNVFTNNTNNKCFSVPGGNARNGAGLLQWHCGDAPNQQWKFVESELSPNVVYLKNKFSGKCATINAGDMRNGAGLVQWGCLDRYNQQIYLPTKGKKGDNKTGGKGEDTTGKKSEPPCNATGWNPEPIVLGVTTEVRALVDSTKCLSMLNGPPYDTAEGGSFSFFPCGGTVNFQWSLIQSKADPEYRNLVRKVNGKCLTLPGGGGIAQPNHALVQVTCGDTPIQQWKFVESQRTPGAVYLKNKSSGKCAKYFRFEGTPFGGTGQTDCVNGCDQLFFTRTLGNE